MLRVSLQNTGKRFNHEWIFRRVNYVLEPGNSYAIIGPNGSGKSTLLQVIGGCTLHNEGTIAYSMNNAAIEPERLFQNLSIAAPYIELVEEMTAGELLTFQQKFKNFDRPVSEILQKVGLHKAANKQIRYFSSGMKQRLKLAQAFFSKSSLLLLDEPTTNLDAEGIDLYKHLVELHTQNKTVVVSSNVQEEYRFCKNLLSVSDYK